MIKSRATAQTGDIATFRFNSYGNNKLLLKLQSHPILGDEDHANYVHATDAIVKVGAVGSANNATSIQINTNSATQYIEVRNAVHGNASNPLRLKLTKTAERDDDFSGETEFEYTLAFVAPSVTGITGDANYKIDGVVDGNNVSADANAANERFGLFTIILTATDSNDNNAQTANVVGRIGIVPHVSIFKLTAAAAASTSINGSDDFSGTVDRAFAVSADGHSSDKFYNFAKIEAALDWATTASFSSAQTTGGIFSVRHAAPTLTDANGALKVRAEAQAYPAGATVSETDGVTTYTFANVAAATALASAAQFGRLIGAQLYDGNTAKANAFVIHKNLNGTTVTIVVSGTGHDTNTPTFQLTALAGQQHGNITSSSITLRAFKGAPDAINNLAGTLPTIKNALTVVSNMQENNGSVASTDNGVLTVTTPSFLNLTGGSVAAVASKISASTNQLILSTKALAEAGATFALNEDRSSCVITLPVTERDITSLIQNGQDADIVDNADTPTVSGTCTSANITLATADDAATGGKTITITAANNAQIPANIGTGSFAIMGADTTDAASLSRAAFTNLDAKFAKLQSADESGAKTNVYLNTNQLNKHAGSLVISGSDLTGTALKVGSLSNTRGRDVTVTVDREAAFTTAGGRSVTTMDVSANHGIQANDILSQVGNAVKATVDSVSSDTLTLKADYEGHFDTSADLTKWHTGDSKFYLMHEQDIFLPETGSGHILDGHIILDKNGVQGKVKTKHPANNGKRKFTLEKSTGLFATGQTPLKAGAEGSEKTLQTNEFKYTTLAATANPADGNAVLQAGTVTAATLNATNLAHEDNGDGTETHTINVDVSTYEDGVSAFNSTGLLTVNGKALKYQEVKLSGNGTASSAVNANQTTVSGKHIKINDTLTGIGAVKAIKVKLTLGATITTAIAKGDNITQHGGEAAGTSTAAHNADALTAGSQLEVLVTTDTKPFDATGDITVGGNTIAVTAVETTLLVDNTAGDLAANDNPKVNGKISGSAGTIQLQEITLNNQYTIAGTVGQTIALAAVGGNAQATGTIKKVTVDGNNTKYLIEAANGGTDFATGVNATVNNIDNKYQRLTVDADIKTHLGDLPTENGIVQKTGNADAGSATVTASDNTNKYIYASNNGAAAFVASTNKTDLKVNQTGWAQAVKTAGDPIVITAFGDGDVAQGMYVTGSGIKPNTTVASATHGTNTITLSKDATLDHDQSLHFHDDTIKLGGANDPTGFIELDISALIASHGFILPPTDSVVSQGNATGTVQGSSANGKIILKTSGPGAASDAFTTATGLSVNIGNAGAKEQKFQKVTVAADDSALGKLSDLSAVATINDTTASVITQLNTSGNEVARGYLRALSGAVATVQVESGEFVTTGDHPLHYGGNTHRYVTLTLPTADILATEKNGGLLQNGNVLTDGTRSGVIRSSSISGSNTVAVVEYTTNKAAGDITTGKLTINGKYQATQVVTLTDDGTFSVPNIDAVITQGDATGTVISKDGQAVTVRLGDTNAFVQNAPIVSGGSTFNKVELTLSATLASDNNLNTGSGFTTAANNNYYVRQDTTGAMGQIFKDENGNKLTLRNVSGTFTATNNPLRYSSTADGGGDWNNVTALNNIIVSSVGAVDDLVDSVGNKTELVASSNDQVLQIPNQVTDNNGLKPATVSGKYYSLTTVQAEQQVQPSAVTIGQMTASAVTNHNATPLNSNGSAYSGSNATLDFTEAGAPVSGQTRRTVSSVLSPSFKVTPAVVGKLANTGTGFTDNAAAPVTATYTEAATSQDLAFQFGHGSYTEQIAAFRFRVTVTCDGSSEKFNVTVHTFSTPSLYFSKYLKTTQKSFVDDATNYQDATISATTGNVQVGGSDSNSGTGTVSSKWQVFRENAAGTFFQNIIGTTPGFAQVNSRLGGGISDYLPILESETLVVASKSGQDVFFKHKSTYDMFDLAGTPAAYPVSDDISKLITSRNLAANSNDTIRIGNDDYSLQNATAAVEAVGGIKQLKITFKGGLDISAIAADQALNLKLAGANTQHNRFDLLTSGDGAVTNESVGPFKVRAVAANWASSEASAGEAYSEKVLLIYHDDTDDKSYVVSSVEVGLQVANTDDGNNFQIKSSMDAAQYSAKDKAIKVFREDIIAHPPTTDGLPIIFASATGGDNAYTFSLDVTGVQALTMPSSQFNFTTGGQNGTEYKLKVNGTEVAFTPSANSGDTAIKMGGLMRTALLTNGTINANFVVSGTDAVVSITQPPGVIANFTMQDTGNLASVSTITAGSAITNTSGGNANGYTNVAYATSANMSVPNGRAIQGTALADQLFVSTGDVTSYNYSTGSDPNRVLTASINLRDHSSSIGTSNDAETFAVTYQPTQTFNALSGFTSQAGATIGNALTTNVTVLNTTGSISGFSAGGIHAWDRGVGNNVDLASVDITTAVAITFDSKGLALKVHLINEGGQNKLKMTTTSAWNGIDNAAVGAGKSTRNVTYGLQGNDANYYRLADRFITGHATGTDGGAASNRYFMTTTGMTAGKALKGYLEYQTNEASTTANGAVTGNTTKVVTVANAADIEVGDALLPANVVVRGTVNNAAATILAPLTVASIDGTNLTLASADDRFTGVQIANGAALTFRETHTVTVGMVTNVFTHNCSGTNGSNTLNLDTENTNVVAGMVVSGTGIREGTTVVSKTNLALTLTNAAGAALTANITNGSITFRADGYVYQADNGTIESATLVNNGIREGSKFNVVSGTGEGNAIPGRAFASNSIDVHVYRDASFRLEDTTTSNATRNNVVSSNLTGTGNSGQNVVAMSSVTGLAVGQVVGPTIDGGTNTASYTNPIPDDTTITNITNNNITLSNNLAATINGAALTFYSVPQRTIHGSVSASTDTKLVRYRTATADGKTGIGAAGNVTTFSVVGSGLHDDAQGSQTAVTIADGGNGVNGSLISLKGDKIFASTPTDYTSEVTIKVKDVNAEAAAQLAASGGIPFGAGVAQHTQHFKLKVIPDPVLAVKANAVATLNVFDKLLVHQADIFKVKANYFADSFNKASMTLNNGATGTVNASKTDITSAGTLDLLKSGNGGVAVVKATIPAPNAVHTDLNFLKLNIDGTNGYVADTHQELGTEITYTAALSDVSKAGANDASYSNITGNVLLTSKTTANFLAKLTRHHNPQILQNAKKANAAIQNVDGQRFTHSATTQTNKASWNFTEFTGRTLGGTGAATTDHYHNIYTLEKSNGVNYAHDDAIITTNHGNGLYPNMQLTSNTSSDSGNFQTVKITDQPKFASSIADGATIPTNLTNDETYLKATFKFTSNDLAGEGTESITYTFTDKLTTKAHPHIRFNHRTSGANDSTIQSETENAVNSGKAGNLPWLVYTAENLASNAPFADWTVAGDTGATTSIQGDTTGKNVSIVTDQTKLKVGTATAYAEADAFKHVFLRRALAGYDGPKGLAQDADGIRLTISAKPVLTVLNRENEANPKYLGLNSTSVNALRDGIKTGDKVHPIGNTIGSDPTQAQFDVGNADGAAGKSDVALTFANGLASFKAVGHSGTANYPGFNFSDSYAIAKDSSNTHFDGSKGSVGFLRVNGGALSIETNTTNIPTRFTNGSGLSDELVAAGTQNLKKVARANDGGFSLSTSGQTVADIDAGGHAFVVQGGRRRTGGAVAVTAQGDHYSMDATLNNLQFADTGATLVVPPRLAYKSTSTPTTNATDTFDITYTQAGSKLLSTDSAHTTITSDATTLTFNVLKNLNETIHIADNTTASTWVSNNNANTGLALSGTTLTDATERNYYYAQTLTPSGNADEKLLAVYFNRVEDLAAITDGSARVANKQHGNLHSITKDDGTVNQTNHGYFHVETTANREAFGIYLHNPTQEGNFKGSTGTASGLTMKLKPNGYSAGALTLDITKLNSVKAPMTESLKNSTGLGNVATVSGGVVVYDAVASAWQTVVPDSTTTNTTSDAPSNVWAAYGDGSTGTGSTYNSVTGTDTFNSKTSPLWSMATLDPTSAQTALTASNVAFSSTTAAHNVAGEQWASLAGSVQAGANGATNNSSANALFQRYYADANKVKTLTHPNWVGDGARHKLDPTATITGAFRIPLENTDNAGTYNVADNAATTDTSARGTNSDQTNTVTLSRQANTYNANAVVKMSNPQKFSLSAKPSFVRHADDANLGAVTNRTRSKIMESMSTGTTTALAHFGPESGGVLGNRVVCFTDLNDLRDALVANGKRQLSDRENRFELDSTPTALAKTSTVVGVARYADATPARRFQLEEHNNKATLSVVLSGADAFYKQNVSCVMVLDTLGESPNDIRVGDYVYQSGLTYSKGVAPNNKTYEQTFGKVILVSSNPPTIKVEFAGLEVNDLHNKAIMDEDFATQLNSTNPGARRGWSQPGYQKAADKTNGETHGDGSSVTHIPFIVSGGVAAKKLTLIRGYDEATNATSNANVKAFQSFDVSSVVVSTSNLTRRLSVNSAMVGRLGSGKTYAIYAQTTGSTEGEQFVDLKITTTGGDSFIITENSVSDRSNGVYGDDRYGDVEISDNFQIGKFGSVDHSAAAQGGFEVTHDSGDNYTFRLGGTANNTWSTVSQVTTATGTIEGNALSTLTLTTTNSSIKKDMVVHGHANLQTGTLVSNVAIANGVSVITLSKPATNAGFNGQAVKFSNDLDAKLLQSADLTALHTSFVVRENVEGDTVFIWRINNSPAPTSTQFNAKLIGGINQVTGNTLGPNVLALGGGQGGANTATAKSMRSEQNVELLPFYVIQTIAPKLSTSYPRSTLPETPYTREVAFNSVVDANQSFQMDMTAGNSTATVQAQWGNNSTTITLAGADVADMRFGEQGTKTRTASLTNGSPTITLLGHVEATTTGASTNTTVPVAATGLANGMKVVGTGITNGTTITVNGNTVTASQAVNVSSGQKLFFTRSDNDDQEAKLVSVDNFAAASSSIALQVADATIITGTSVSGPGIASGTVVTAINSLTLTLSNATTANGGGNLIFERSVFIGMTATSGNIPAKAYVTAVSGNSITLSANATGTATGQVSFSNIGPGAYVTTAAGTGIQADTHVVEYNGDTTVTINQNTSAAQGTDTAVSFKTDSQYDNIVAVSGGTSFTPESYIYRLDRHLKTYKLTYVQSTVSAFGKLTLHTEQGETSSDRTTDKPTKDSHGINLVNNRRYLIVAVDYAERVADANPTVTTTYNGYYKYDSGNDVFLYDNSSGVSGNHFGMDTGRVEPTASTNIGPYRIAIIPSGDATTYNAYNGGFNGNQAMANIGGLFSTSSSALPNDDMKEIRTNGSTKPTFQRMTQLIRNEGAQYTRGSTNGFPYYRIQDVPSRLDHSDLVIVLLRADANTSANNLTLKYDRIMNGDSIQAYQLRGAVDYSGMSSDLEWSGNPVVGTTTKMPVFYQNVGTELNPLASQIELSTVSPSPLAAADTAIFGKQDLRSYQFLHSSNSGTSLRYSRQTAPLAPTGADSTTNFTTYDSTKKVFQFRAANSLTLDNTESLPLFD